MHGGDLIGEVMVAHEVKYLFTLCGGHIAPILVGCKKRGIQVIDVRHEANGVFAADAMGRLTGVPGVAAVTAGPGLTNTITAVKNAQMAESPLVILGGATATMLKGRGSLQDIDQKALMKPHVKWMASAKKVKDLVPLMEQAFCEARSGVPGPVFLEVPIDLLYEEDLVRSWYGVSNKKARSLGEAFMNWYITRHVDKLFDGKPSKVEPKVYSTSCPYPSEGEVERVAHLITKSHRPIMLIGSQALIHPSKAPEIKGFIEDLSLPVYLSGMARGLLGRDHPLQRRHKRREALKQADLVILVGVPCDFRLDYGRHINSKGGVVLVNLDGEELSKNRDLIRNRKPRREIFGDPMTFLKSLAKARKKGEKQDWSPWKEELSKREEDREKEIEKQREAPVDQYINPLEVFTKLESFLDDEALLVADGGDFVATASYILKPRKALTWLDPGVFGTLGVGAGFAMAAKLTNPKKEVWLIYGDGSSGYGLAEFDTFCRHKIPVIALVGNDACWSQIAREQNEILGDSVGTVLARTDYHKVAEAYGAKGLMVDRGKDLEKTYQEARKLASEGHPVLINCLIGKTDFRKGSISM